MLSLSRVYVRFIFVQYSLYIDRFTINNFTEVNNMENKVYLVTGIAGNLGSSVASRLLADGKKSAGSF